MHEGNTMSGRDVRVYIILHMAQPPPWLTISVARLDKTHSSIVLIFPASVNIDSAGFLGFRVSCVKTPVWQPRKALEFLWV